MSGSAIDARARAAAAGWLREGERPRYDRLRYPLASDLPTIVFDENRDVRDAVLADMLGGGYAPVPNPPCLPGDPAHDVLIAEVERYNLPMRTVLSRRTGLMRSDPYYPPAYLPVFYGQHYRRLYRAKRWSDAQFLADQLVHGQRIWWRTHKFLKPGARVLDVGCGMGGNLVPFQWQGYRTIGCDYGADYLDKGRQLALDLRTGGVDAVAGEGPFDLIILSHVLEHTPDPIGTARQARSLLADGGICYIEVPGIFVIDKWYGGDLLGYLQSAHLWHFTERTLAAVLSRGGLGIEQSDPAIWCIARPIADKPIEATDGDVVLAELDRLERSFQQQKRQEAAT